ncbi:MAG: Gfo/Idh/MocA family oxidoreductase [Verrucomicrobiales bacterium]|nr:Gfo/Idh/MocA family oxidoreductase [Verrucomicrobiales bacterium]
MTPSSVTSAPLTRRGFLKSSSTAVGGIALANLAAERFALGASPGDTVKVALVGCGGRGSGAANQALSTSGSTKLVAMADAFKERLDGSLNNLKNAHKDKVQVPDECKFIGFDGYKKAIELADVVILATPPGFRPIHFEEAVRQGKHVFMEKPVAVDGPGVRRVIAAAEEAVKKNLKVGVGLQRHHQPVYLETMKRLHDGAIGDILSMRAYWNDAGVWVRSRAELAQKLGRPPTEMEYQMYNWYYFVWLSGDHICEQHIHNLDVIQWVKQGKPYDPTGKTPIVHPKRCIGMGGRQVRTGKENGEIFDHHAVQFEYPDGTYLFSECRHIQGAWASVSEHAVGTKGSCNIGGGTITGANSWRFRSEKSTDAYQQEHDDIFDAIRNDKPFNEAFYGAHSSMLSIMGRMATYSGKEVSWEDAYNSQLDVMPKTYAWDAPTPVNPDKDGFYPIAVPGKTVTF